MSFSTHQEQVEMPKGQLGDYANKEGKLSESLQTMPGDKSFNASWNEMTRANNPTVQQLLGGLELFNDRNDNVAQLHDRAPKSLIMDTQLTDSKRDLGDKLPDQQKNEKDTHKETHTNKDGSVVHSEDGKVTSIDYPNGAHAEFKYDETGRVARVEIMEPDGGMMVVQRSDENGPDGKPKYIIMACDADGNMLGQPSVLKNGCVIVGQDGSFSVGGYTGEKDKNGNPVYEYLDFPTDNPNHVKTRKGDPPQEA